ncbi:MAG: DUF5103 domain-containing protein [Chitinophagales bacterium]
MIRFFLTNKNPFTHFFCLTLLLLWTSSLLAQLSADSSNIDYYYPNILKYEDAVYKENIRTVLFHVKDQKLTPAIIPLSGGLQLALTFDELGEEVNYYSYQLILCNADWTPSSLDSFDYVDGFIEQDISDYRFSLNTFQPYTQYRLMIPNESMGVTKSGNYLLKIYRSGDEEDLVLTRRMVVYENYITIKGRFLNPTLTAVLKTHQRLDFSVVYEGLNIVNPIAELDVVVLQNGRWDNALMGLKPTFMHVDELIYNFANRNLFEAGNEFRYADFRSMRYRSERVKNLEEDKKLREKHVYLKTDEVRTRDGIRLRINYLDFNGRYQIGVQDGLFNYLDADYAFVHFNLPFEEPLTDGNIYVFGGFTDWEVMPRYQMKYNYEQKAYQACLYLKQGFYNYQYVLLEDGNPVPKAAPFEGNYYKTENDYIILVYHRKFGARYDRLIGIKTLNSRI